MVAQADDAAGQTGSGRFCLGIGGGTEASRLPPAGIVLHRGRVQGRAAPSGGNELVLLGWRGRALVAGTSAGEVECLQFDHHRTVRGLEQWRQFRVRVGLGLVVIGGIQGIGVGVSARAQLRDPELLEHVLMILACREDDGSCRGGFGRLLGKGAQRVDQCKAEAQRTV